MARTTLKLVAATTALLLFVGSLAEARHCGPRRHHRHHCCAVSTASWGSCCTAWGDGAPADTMSSDVAPPPDGVMTPGSRQNSGTYSAGRPTYEDFPQAPPPAPPMNQQRGSSQGTQGVQGPQGTTPTAPIVPNGNRNDNKQNNQQVPAAPLPAGSLNQQGSATIPTQPGKIEAQENADVNAATRNAPSND